LEAQALCVSRSATREQQSSAPALPRDTYPLARTEGPLRGPLRIAGTLAGHALDEKEAFEMLYETTRRRFLKHMGVAGGVGLLGARRVWAESTSSPQAQPAALSPVQKAKLKAELQRELERKVYAVDEELFRKVNRAARPGEYEGHERSHVPKIIAPKQVRRFEAFPVRVIVGVDELHEMQAFHYVDWIALTVDSVQVGFASIAPIFCQPSIAFELTVEGDVLLRAQEHCNLHGTWESEPWEIKVI
jgi:superoxide reductase